jgi:hypothetical protein
LNILPFFVQGNLLEFAQADPGDYGFWIPILPVIGLGASKKRGKCIEGEGKRGAS